MAITSVVYYLVTRHTWGWSPARSLAILLLFLSFDIPFVFANGLKFFDGGYLPFAVGAAVVLVMVSWRVGRSYLADVMDAESEPVEVFLANVDAGVRARLPGAAIMMASRPEKVPPVLVRLWHRFQVVHERVVLVTVVTEHVPVVAASTRSTATPLGKGLTRVVLRYGFMEKPNVPRGLEPVLGELGIDAASVVYLLGRETPVVGDGGRMGRLTERVFAFLSRNARSVTDDFSIPVERVVELGMQIDL
jgi:KUP system potassium uptake protein